MNAPVKTVRRELLKRFLWMFGACLIQLIYTPTSLWLQGGIAPKTAWDVFPVITVWVVPYVLCYPLWLGCGIWATLKMNADLFRAWLNACVFTFSIGIATFVIFPTYVVPVELPGRDFFSLTLLSLQVAGGTHDALPSAHIYVTTLIALFFAHWYPRQRALWVLIFIVVALSTLFTGQHYILDVVAGAMLGWLGYRFGMWRANLPEWSRRSLAA